MFISQRVARTASPLGGNREECKVTYIAGAQRLSVEQIFPPECVNFDMGNVIALIEILQIAVALCRSQVEFSKTKYVAFYKGVAG